MYIVSVFFLHYVLFVVDRREECHLPIIESHHKKSQMC